ncbi:hypothetical protein B0H34DRAFT_809113 [Crassisporium funariophilum]|nr:hypothetical protein B0H34DRAFT_809113 [Crassisporium funariophilum]
MDNTSQIEVKLGFGGEGNWIQHVNSKSHISKGTQSKPKVPKKTLVSYFSKSTGVRGPVPTPVKAPALLSRKTTDIPPTVIPSSSTSLPLPTAAHYDAPSLHPLLLSLRQVIDTLPGDIPEATTSDTLAIYAAPPTVDPDNDEGPWRAIDGMLNRVIGFGATPESLKALIRRGHFGIDGLYLYFKSCIEDIKIEPALLEGKIERVVEAMILCGSTRSAGSDKNESLTAVTSSQGLSVKPNDERSRSPSLEIIAEAHEMSTTSAHAPPVDAVPPAVPCPGYKMKLPPTASPYSSYPSTIHSVLTLPWDIFIHKNGIQLFSTMCSKAACSTKKGKETEALPCMACAQLRTNTALQGIEDRLENGNHENTSYAYLTPVETSDLLRRKTGQVKRLKLNALNKASALSVRNRRLDAWKRLAVAVGREDIPRIRSLMAREVRAGSSVFAILERIDAAAKRKFIPRGYEQADYERGYLIYMYGGRPAAQIARSLGIPSIDTIKRRVAAKPLQSSPGYPTTAELHTNLAHCYPDATPAASFNPSAPVLGMTMQIDEIKIQERLRWDPRSNQILGVCREHGKAVGLEFRSIHQADALLASLQQEKVHLATEASVIGTSILTGNPADYSTRVFVISGSCKLENYQEHKRLLSDSAKAVRHTQEPCNRRLYCICTDGEARRRRSLIDLCLNVTLDPLDPIYPLLAPLPLFNLRCGPNNVTPDFDWKHVFKRFRNTLLRIMGFTLDGIRITSSVLQGHLLAAGMATHEVDALLSPNDKQDVTLMLRLLVAMSNIPPPKPSDQPTIQATRRVLRLLGRLYFYLLNAYLDINLSLHTQLVYLSAAAHIILALYSRDKGDFIPVQTYFDVMSMIKNIYFCVAKTQCDNPNGFFYIILLGTDGLEKIFGKVRSMVGNDTNVDALQLTNRVDGATQCVVILERHPEWGGQARRLDLKPLDSNVGEITSKYDHLSPRSLKGNYRVSQVVLLTSWNEGRTLATQELESARIAAPFASMEAEGGYDMFCPFGQGKMVLVETELHEGERHESEEEEDISTDAHTPAESDPVGDEGLEPDIDDLAGTAELEIIDDDGTGAGSNADATSPWVLLPNASKPTHKASVLRLYSNPLSITSNSHDRLKRVRGYSRYEEPTKPDPTSVDGEEDALCIQDPVVTLVRADDRVFLAVCQVLAIRRDGLILPSLLPQFLVEPNVRLQVQLMRIEQVLHASNEIDALRADWEWTGASEHRGNLKDILGRNFLQINPVFEPATRGRTPGEDTYVFQTAELRSMSAILYERLRDDLLLLPTISVTPSFPYRNTAGQACFICEDDTREGDFRHSQQLPCCQFCPGVLISTFNGQNLLKHMASHILHDTRVDKASEPCGFCLNTTSPCKIFLKRNGAIDMQKSRCPYLRNIRINQARTFSKLQPCTNHPLRCKLCSPDGTAPDKPAVWKYNFLVHLSKVHPSALPENHTSAWQSDPQEKTLMRRVFEDRKRQRKSALSSKKPQLLVSDAHSSRLALRDSSDEGDDDVDDEDSNEDGDEDGNDDDSGVNNYDAQFEAFHDMDDDWIPPAAIAHEDIPSSPPRPFPPATTIAHEHIHSSSPHPSEARSLDPAHPTVGALSNVPPPLLVLPPENELPPDAPATASSSQALPATNVSIPDVQPLSIAPLLVPPSSSPSSGKRKRVVSLRFLETYGNSDSQTCASCERAFDGEQVVHCSSAGCNLVYHLECQGLIDLPQSEWYCDDECKLTARGRSANRKKSRRGGK